MADRDVEVDITANDKTAAGVRSAARNFDGLDRKVKAGSKSRNTQLERDAKKSVSIFESLFGGLVKEGQKAGMLAGGATVDGFGAAFKALPPEVKIGVAASVLAGATAAAPALVATLNAAVLAGVGGGALALGIKLAVKDPEVAASLSYLQTYIGARLQQSVQPFNKELIASSEIFRDSFDNVSPAIDRIFGRLSTKIQPLARGLSQGLENAFPGLERAIEASLPLLQDLADELPRVGRLAGELFDSIADAGPGAELAFKIVLITVEALIKMLQWLVDSLGPVANGVAALADAGAAAWDKLGGGDKTKVITNLNQAGQAATTAAGGFGQLASEAEFLAQETGRANDAFEELFGTVMGLDEATLRVKAGFTGLAATLRQNNGSLDENTAKGQANRAAILQQVQAIEAQREAAIRAGNGSAAATAKANAAYLAQLQQLRAVAQAAGVNTAAIDAMIRKYQQIPSNVTTTITTRYKTIGTPSGPVELGPGQSREKFSGLDTWAPARFAASGSFAESGGGGRTQPPTEVRSTVDVTNVIELDGKPFRAIAKQVATDQNKRQAWRDRVGKR